MLPKYIACYSLPCFIAADHWQCPLFEKVGAGKPSSYVGNTAHKKKSAPKKKY